MSEASSIETAKSSVELAPVEQPDRRRSGQLPTRTLITLAVVLVILLTPILVYVWTFGTNLSTNHARWGEMGSAMSGIYSPILAFLALLVVYGQLKSQNRFNESQSQFNTHEMHQRYVEQARSDIQYYLEQLDRVLQVRDPNGATVREMLHHHFRPLTKAELEAPALVTLGEQLNEQYPQLIALWGAIYAALKGVQAVDKYPFTLVAATSVQKIIVMTTFKTSVALDNFHECMVKGRVRFPYQFSLLLCDKE